MKNKDDSADQRKDYRRKKLENKYSHEKNRVHDDDNQKKTQQQKKEIKKIKESFEDEEWEDWDRYYNH